MFGLVESVSYNGYKTTDEKVAPRTREKTTFSFSNDKSVFPAYGLKFSFGMLRCGFVRYVQSCIKS